MLTKLSLSESQFLMKVFSLFLTADQNTDSTQTVTGFLKKSEWIEKVNRMMKLYEYLNLKVRNFSSMKRFRFILLQPFSLQ